MIGAALLTAAALVALPGAAAGKEPTPRYGGTVVVAVLQEPPTLNVVQDNSPAIAAAVTPVLHGVFMTTPNLRLRLDLVERVDVRQLPSAVTYRIKSSARWSDGKPVTAHDFVFTWRVHANPNFAILSRFGYDVIRSARVLDAKTVRLEFRRPLGEWRALFHPVLPRHALDGLDFDRVWRDALDNPKTGRSIGNGPFLLASWRRGHSMTFVRNERYWGKKPYLSRLVYRLYPDVATAVEALRAGRIDVLSTQPELQLASLLSERGIRVQSALGFSFELLQFNLGYRAGGHPALRKRFVREAIVRAIDRTAITRGLYGWLTPRLPALHNPFVMPQEGVSRPWWATYRHSSAAARRILERSGCRPGADGTYVCQGERLSFRFSTTVGNQLRERAQRLIQRNLRSAGIDVRLDNVPGPVLFSQRLPSGDYDIAMYAWGRGPLVIGDWPQIYGCGGPRNNQSYCNRRVDRLFQAVRAEVDLRRQIQLMNRAAELMAVDLPIVPLFQRPSFLAYRSVVHGIRENNSVSSYLWNVEQWWKERPR